MATELGKAYVQIIPSAQGIGGKISSLLKGESQSAGTTAGGIIGSGLVKKLKTVIAAAGIGKAISASISEGAKLQQSIGGVETLFKESAGRVREYASQAYKTSGVSANEYMEGVTSFAASLLQSTAGNTRKAADVSNMAFMDMSDNANKMGTHMGDIQNAYQGFAKQNYTMLDNLKLGYGGTKSEMQRLLADAQKLTGVKYDINNLSDVYQAIHAVQGELGITGTTAKEAATTISGSAGQMKSAFKDALGSIAIGENVQQSFANLATTVKTFVFDNLIPMVMEIFKNIPAGLASFATTMGPMLMQEGTKLIDSLSQGFTTGFPKLITKAGEIITNLITGFTQNAPKLIQSGVKLIKNLMKGLIDNIPLILEKAGEIILKLVEAIITVAPQLLSAGIELATNLSKGLWEKMPEMLAKLGEFLVNLVKLIIEKAPEFLAKGKELMEKMKEGFLQVKDAAKEAMVTIITAIIDFIKSKASDFLEKGKELIDKVKEGFNAKKEAVKQAITNIITAVITFIKSKASEFLNKGKELIGKVKDGFIQKKNEVVNAGKQIIEAAKTAISNFKNKFIEVGKNIIDGVAQGIRNGIGRITSAARDAANKALSAAKSALGIHSPSKVFANEVGKWIPAGMADGITGNLKVVKNAMNDMTELGQNDLNNELDYKIKTDSFLNSESLKTNEEELNKDKFINLNLSIGGQNFKALVDRISLEQDKDIELKLAY
jgi:phage-related protein